MASGTSGAGQPTDSVSGGFDFGSDNVFCSYEDYGNKDANNEIHPDPSSASNSTEEFNKNRMARPSAYPTAGYSPPEESSVNHVAISTVESTMKKHTDNLMRFLEGISARLSQLELYCYNLDKSIGEMRSDLVRDRGEAESKLKSLEKHIEEVLRAVQILRDKQELADAQKELAKLHLAQKESSSTSDTQQSDTRAVTPTPEAKETKNAADSHNQQLALVPHHVIPQPSRHAQPQSLEHQQPHPALSPSMPSQSMTLPPLYYLTSPQMTNTVGVSQPSQSQYLPAQSQLQEHSRMQTPPGHYHINQSSHVQPASAYPQQWPQQQQQHPVQQPQQPVMQPKIRTPTQIVCSNHIPNQPNQPPAEMASNTVAMQAAYAGASQSGFAGPEALSYGYGAAGRPMQPQPSTQHVKTAYGAAQPGNSYTPSGPRPTLHPGNAYLMYDNEGRVHHPPPQVHFQQSAFPSSTVPPQKSQQAPGANMGVLHSSRHHPSNELIEKLVSMGYRSDHVIGIIQRLEESGQPIDFNSVLDRLNAHSAEGTQRGWSG